MFSRLAFIVLAPRFNFKLKIKRPTIQKVKNIGQRIHIHRKELISQSEVSLYMHIC